LAHVQAQERLADALADCGRAAALHPDFRKALSRAAALHLSLRLPGAAADALRAALALPGVPAAEARALGGRLHAATALAEHECTPDHFKMLGLGFDATVRFVHCMRCVYLKATLCSAHGTRTSLHSA
jgi:hypothetical protein